MVLGRIIYRHSVCALYGTVVAGVAGRGLDADDVGAAVVCWQLALQCGPGCSLSSIAR